MSYDESQVACEQAFQRGEGGPFQLRQSGTGALNMSSQTLEVIEPAWTPAQILWARNVDARGPYWRVLG